MPYATRITQKLHIKHIYASNSLLTNPPHYKQPNLLLACGQNVLFSELKCVSGLIQSYLGHNHRASHRTQVRSFSTDHLSGTSKTLELSEEACPQGIQGDDCVTFKMWLENCRRYGLQNCNGQLQGLKTSRKTLAEVIAEQNRLIAEIAKEYSAASNSHKGSKNSQGFQQNETVDVEIDTPCPQGIQGSDCADFKLWLENCQRFGVNDSNQQFEHFKAGRKSLAQIFAEQDIAIRKAAAATLQKMPRPSRKYSTSSKSSGDGTSEKSGASLDSKPEELSQRQRLKLAVKDYGSTVIIFHVTISLMSLGFFYLLVSSGVDVVGLLKKMNIGGTMLENKVAAGAGTFIVAYAVHKVFAPVRIAATLTATPLIVRYLRRVGFLKSPEQAKLK